MAENKKTWKTYGNKIPSNDKECFYCEGRLWNGNRTTDHIVPKSKGGILSNANKVFACKRCNQMKQDHSVEDFRGMIFFLLKEFDKEHKENTDYYRKVISNVDALIANKENGKAKKGLPSNKKRS